MKLLILMWQVHFMLKGKEGSSARVLVQEKGLKVGVFRFGV